MKTPRNELTLEQSRRILKSKEEKFPSWIAVLLFTIAYFVAATVFFTVRYLK